MARTTLSAQVATLTAQVEALTQALAAQQAQQAKADKAPQVSKTGKKKTATFMKFNPETGKRDIAVKCTPGQKRAWEAHSNRTYVSAEERQERFAEHAEKMSTYKPSKALKDAIKRDRASITFAVAKEQYGFVGTKQTLKALKAEVLSK